MGPVHQYRRTKWALRRFDQDEHQFDKKFWTEALNTAVY